MGNYLLIPLFPDISNRNLVNVIIENPKGSHNKYDLDPVSGILVLDRPIHSSLVFPANYGCLPETTAGDGDPLDAVVLSGFPLLAGSVVEARIVGALVLEDEGGMDPKIICIAESDPRLRHIQNFDNLDKIFLEELKHFFVHIKDLEKEKWAKFYGFENQLRAVQLVAKYMDLHLKEKL
jgi:inorganic pyrophosphatase